MVYKAIFEAERGGWHRDTGTGPAGRANVLFRKWFEVRFHPLIQGLVGEEITATERKVASTGKLHTELEGPALNP